MRRRAVALATVAMALNFLWFDLPGHGTAFLAHDLLLRQAFADGHTLFLLGYYHQSAGRFKNNDATTPSTDPDSTPSPDTTPASEPQEA